jgi:hypothetical protein
MQPQARNIVRRSQLDRRQVLGAVAGGAFFLLTGCRGATRGIPKTKPPVGTGRTRRYLKGAAKGAGKIAEDVLENEASDLLTGGSKPIEVDVCPNSLPYDCGGYCCGSGEVCCGGAFCGISCDNGRCCPVGSVCCHGRCCATSCCDNTGTCCRYEPGTATCCPNGGCCPSGEVCCGGGCCSPGYFCCGDRCYPSYCRDTNTCCAYAPGTATCCPNGGCCPRGQRCCGSGCCYA